MNSRAFELLTHVVQIKAWIADNSRALSEVSNAEMDDSSRKVMLHELIGGSLSLCAR